MGRGGAGVSPHRSASLPRRLPLRPHAARGRRQPPHLGRRAVRLRLLLHHPQATPDGRHADHRLRRRRASDGGLEHRRAVRQEGPLPARPQRLPLGLSHLGSRPDDRHHLPQIPLGRLLHRVRPQRDLRPRPHAPTLSPPLDAHPPRAGLPFQPPSHAEPELPHEPHRQSPYGRRRFGLRALGRHLRQAYPRPLL